VALYLEGIVGSVGARAIASFGVDVARIHWDMTSISLYGAYPSSDPDHIDTSKRALGTPRTGART